MARAGRPWPKGDPRVRFEGYVSGGAGDQGRWRGRAVWADGGPVCTLTVSPSPTPPDAPVELDPGGVHCQGGR